MPEPIPHRPAVVFVALMGVILTVSSWHQPDPRPGDDAQGDAERGPDASYPLEL